MQQVNKNRRHLHRLCSLMLCLVLGSTWLSSPAYAKLPPRPLTPQEDEKETPRPLVAAIVLETTPTGNGLWSVVQWQDEQGGWHDIESWRGTVVNGRTIWWVEEKDFGKGPYRWLVFAHEKGTLLATSDLFNFPAQPKTQLVVEVTLP